MSEKKYDSRAQKRKAQWLKEQHDQDLLKKTENTAMVTGLLTVAAASSSFALGKDTSEADQDHHASPCHTGLEKESEAEELTLQPT